MAPTSGDLRTVLIPTPVKTAAYNAHHGEFVLVDATSGAVPITLPLNPPANGTVGVMLVATAAGHLANINAAGPDSFNTWGGVTTWPLAIAGQSVVLQYNSGVWAVQSGGLPLSGLDGRYAAGQDPLQIGYAATFTGNETANTAAVLTASAAYYQRLLAGGYPISTLAFRVEASAGHVCVGTYANTGTGTSAAPGSQTSTSGSVATPAIGTGSVSLGATVTPALGDWAALSVDTSPSTIDVTVGSAIVAGRAAEQASAFPLPATPSGLAPLAARWILMRGA